MPFTRLQPLPFPEPERFIDIVEEDPSVIEAGLRIVARRVPVPGAGSQITVDILALDRSQRVAAIDVAPRLSAASLEAAAASHEWIRASLPALRTLCPSLSRSGGEPRSILIGGRIDPAIETLFGRMGAPGMEILEASLFEAAGGISMNLRRVGRPPARADAPETVPGPMAGAPAGEGSTLRADPLAGIPISAEELAEFRSLIAPRVPKAPARRKGAVADPLPAPPPRAMVEN